MQQTVPGARTITGATAFNEMRILDREGRAGNHLVDVGILRLVVEPSDNPWEHLRTAFASHRLLTTLENAGWTVVAQWGIWTYLKRPLLNQ